MIRWHEVNFSRCQKWVKYNETEKVLGYQLECCPIGNTDPRLRVSTPLTPYPDGVSKFTEELWLPLERQLFAELRSKIETLESGMHDVRDDLLEAALGLSPAVIELMLKNGDGTVQCFTDLLDELRKF
jgi:hypothetical protein